MGKEKSMEYARILAEMIRIETISDWNQEDLSVFFGFHEKLKELFPNVFERCQVEVFDGSLLIKWEGKSDTKKKPILIMYHQDVVEAPGKWTHPPFSGVIDDGRLWGRGTIDVKSGVFGMLQAANELIAEGYIPQQDIYFESARNEETDGTGADAIAKILKERGIEFEMVLDEGGIIINEPIPGVEGYFAMVGLGEKSYSDVRFIAKSNGGHASAPPTDTPLVRLGKFMAEIDSRPPFEVKISSAVEIMFKRYATSMNGILKLVFKHPKLFAPLIKKVMPKKSATAKALVQTTVGFTQAQASEFSNVLPQEASVMASMRFSHHEGIDEGLRKISAVAKKYDIEVRVEDRGVESKLCSPHTETYKKFEEVIHDTFHDVKIAPYIAITAGDGRFFSDLTENCFRFLPIKIDDQQFGSTHGIDENIYIDGLDKLVGFYRSLMQKDF